VIVSVLLPAVKSTETYALLFEAWRDLHDIKVLWELAVIAASLALAWWLNRAVAPRFASPDTQWAAGLGGLQRALFPLVALLLALIGRGLLGQWQTTPLLHLAVPLLVALALVRVLAYMMRIAFAPSGAVIATERVIAWIVWLGFAAHITGLMPALFGFFGEVGFGTGEQRVTLKLLLEGTLSVLVTLLIALWLGRLIEGRLLRAEALDMNLRVMFAKLFQALLVLVAVLIALPAVGIDLTVLSVFGGAVGVGLGFGLQKIASNYVSGFIILMDRSVSLGDVITVDRYSGELIKMTARYVVVRGPDGTETLIPNETLVTSPVVNLSYSDRRVRVAVPLQVGYRSDLWLARSIMREVAAGHPRALREPAPDALIKQFGTSGIDLELGVWIEDPQRGQANLRSELYAAIWEAFQSRGVEIPYPQREIRIVTEAPERPA
jgi:small-conductance mechanosensitive channel